MTPAIPDRWLKYTPCGVRIAGTRFIAFKVPLRQNTVKLVARQNRLDDDILLRMVPNLGLVIDLTNTDRYYDPNVFLRVGIAYKKLRIPGRETPPNNLVDKFKLYVAEFLNNNNNNDKLIGVHCTHGVNRTGYLICNYMISELKISPQEAISKFQIARGHEMEHDYYINALKSLPQFDNSSAIIPSRTFSDQKLLVNNNEFVNSSVIPSRKFSDQKPLVKNNEFVNYRVTQQRNRPECADHQPYNISDRNGRAECNDYSNSANNRGREPRQSPDQRNRRECEDQQLYNRSDRNRRAECNDYLDSANNRGQEPRQSPDQRNRRECEDQQLYKTSDRNGRAECNDYSNSANNRGREPRQSPDQRNRRECEDQQLYNRSDRNRRAECNDYLDSANNRGREPRQSPDQRNRRECEDQQLYNRSDKNGQEPRQSPDQRNRRECEDQQLYNRSDQNRRAGCNDYSNSANNRKPYKGYDRSRRDAGYHARNTNRSPINWRTGERL